MEAEATMICVDNSGWMKGPIFQEQADAIRIYCTEKLNANPNNVVGIASSASYMWPLHVAASPTRDIKTIMNAVFGLPIGGPLDLRKAIVGANLVWCNGLNEDLKKRIVVFAGGDTDAAADARPLGPWLKKWDIAFDAVNFGRQSSDKRQLLETLVAAAAENNHNSHILHVEPHMSVSQALASSQIIPTRVGESSSPPPEIKDKQHYSKIPYVDGFDLFRIALGEVIEEYEAEDDFDEHVFEEHKAAAIAQAAEY